MKFIQKQRHNLINITALYLHIDHYHYMHTTQPRKVLYTHTHAHVKHVKKNILYEYL